VGNTARIEVIELSYPRRTTSTVHLN